MIKKIIKLIIPHRWINWYLYDYKKYVSPQDNPEAKICIPYCIGKGLDIGCGGNKTVPSAIGVDIIKGKGKYGNQQSAISQADIITSGDNLYMFKDNELDYIVSRHNLEHYVDIIKTLEEWKRVLKKGGKLCLVIPDNRYGDTVRLDPTHCHAFTPESLMRILQLVKGFKIIDEGVAIKQWSFYIILEKK